MGYGFQPAESIPLSYISYQAVFPTPPCRSRQWARLNSRVWFPVLSVVRFHRDRSSRTDSRAFPSHGRGRRFNTYSAHQKTPTKARLKETSAPASPIRQGRTSRDFPQQTGGKSGEFVRQVF